MLDKYLAVKSTREPPFIDPAGKENQPVPRDLPFKWEERPRGGKCKQPAAAKMDSGEARMDIDDDKMDIGEIKEQGDSKDGVKSPSKDKPKVFIKAKKSRWFANDFEEMQDDPTSYSKGLITYEEQANNEPDFIGSAFYYNLTKTAVRCFIR